MVATGKSKNRVYIGKKFQETCELPDLIGIQKESYESFLQSENLKKGLLPETGQGLEDVFESTFPISSQNNEMILNFESYKLDFENIKFSEIECKKKGRTFSVPLKAVISLELAETGEIREKEIFFGDLPLMTERGTFVINGAERVVVSQIHRSPGVIFAREKGVLSSRIIPYRGSWLEFEIDEKKKIIVTKIDRKKRILGTLFLRAIGYDTREKILNVFYKSKEVAVSEETKDIFPGLRLYKDVFATIDGEQRKVLRAGDAIQAHMVDELISMGVTSLMIIDMDKKNPDTLHDEAILNCFDIEDAKYTDAEAGYDEPTKETVLTQIFSVLMSGEMVSIERAERELPEMFFSSRRYNLGSVGRYKLIKKFSNDENEINTNKSTVLCQADIVNTMRFLIKVYDGEENVDDIDHLGNRRVRSVGELLQQ